MQKPKYFSLPVKYEVQEFNDDRFKKVRIYVMHDKLNYNNSYFDMSAIESAKDSITNIPILAFVKETDGDSEKDFAGHEMELVITSDNIKMRYLGRPIGIIPSDNNNYHYETFDNKTYVVVDGYIWTNYANEALEILERDLEKGQSMEIVIDEADFDNENKYYQIKKYRYTGLTLLGDNVTPAMQNAKVKMLDNETQFSSLYSQMIEELNVTLNKYTQQEEVKLVEDEVVDTEVIEDVEINETQDTEIIDEQSEVVDGVIEKNADETTEEIIETESEATQEVVKEVVTEIENNSIEATEIVSENFQVKVQELEVELESALKENEELKAYKYGREKEDKMNIISKFSNLTEDETKPLVENIDNYSVEELELQLFALLGKKNAEFSKTEKPNQNKDEHLIFALSNKKAISDSNTPAWVEYVEQHRAQKQK